MSGLYPLFMNTGSTTPGTTINVDSIDLVAVGLAVTVVVDDSVRLIVLPDEDYEVLAANEETDIKTADAVVKLET